MMFAALRSKHCHSTGQNLSYVGVAKSTQGKAKSRWTNRLTNQPCSMDNTLSKTDLVSLRVGLKQSPHCGCGGTDSGNSRLASIPGRLHFGNKARGLSVIDV